MEDRNTKPEPDRMKMADRTGPIPLADRRRMMRPPEKTDAPAKIFTDWASI